MAPEDYALIAPHLRRCGARRGDTLFFGDAEIETVWFMDAGLCSLVTVSNGGQRVEAGIWGSEGFAPVAPVLGADLSKFEGQVQMPGECWRMSAAALQDAIGRSARLHMLLLRYVQTLQTQIAHTALSNAVHTVEERLARWLLMCHDRVEGNELALTHEFLATVLAVRRPSVTTSLHLLEGSGFIRAERGCVIIRNRAAMEEFAADGYGAPEREYARLIGLLR